TVHAPGAECVRIDVPVVADRIDDFGVRDEVTDHLLNGVAVVDVEQLGTRPESDGDLTVLVGIFGPQEGERRASRALRRNHRPPAFQADVELRTRPGDALAAGGDLRGGDAGFEADAGDRVERDGDDHRTRRELLAFARHYRQ